jgi:hypothetical protein
MTGLKVFLDRVAEDAKLYDVTERALAAGKRRRRIRRLAVPSGAAAVTGAVVAAVALAGGGAQLAAPQSPANPSPTLTVASSSAAVDDGFPTRCVAERLPTPKGHGPKSVVTGGDPTGRYVLGRSYPGGGRDRLLIWEDGKVRHVVPIEGADPHLYDINTGGVAVGISFVGPYGKETEVAWVVTDGKAQRLKGQNAAAVGINEAGVIVGTVDDQPVVWRTADSAPEILPGPPGKWIGSAGGIDEDGTIVGTFGGIGVPQSLAYAWSPDGTARELAPVAADTGLKPSGASAGSIRDGVVLGGSHFEDARSSTTVTTLWNLRTGEVTTRPDVFHADEANARGWTIGQSRAGPVLSSGTRSVVLPPAEGTRTGGPTEVFEVISLSDDGRTIAGYQDAAEGKLVVVAVRWRCS